jgi:cyclophilin family peptidyl-prolyl cis-trans isomerase
MKMLILAALLFVAGCAGDNMTQNTAEKSDTVIIETSMGNIELQLDRANAPSTVENFLKYADSGFYNGTIFHRVIPGFMIQGGGFSSDGSQKQTLAPIQLENPVGNVRGTIAMARTMDPNSATAQFFINTVDNRAGLDASARTEGYAVFGKVVSGMDVVDKISGVSTGSRGPHRDWPVQDVSIKAVIRK